MISVIFKLNKFMCLAVDPVDYLMIKISDLDKSEKRKIISLMIYILQWLR